MSKGGARARSGPPPDPNALTYNEAEWTVLPAAGREGEAPAWPLADARQRELDIWAEEWTRPQAVMWERQGQALEVALYVRSVVAAENHDASTAARTLVKQLMEALGISVPGLLRNHWRIAEAPAAPAAGAAPATPGSSRGRLTVVGA